MKDSQFLCLLIKMESGKMEKSLHMHFHTAGEWPCVKRQHLVLSHRTFRLQRRAFDQSGRRLWKLHGGVSRSFWVSKDGAVWQGSEKNDKDNDFRDEMWEKNRRGAQQWKQQVYSPWSLAYFVMWGGFCIPPCFVKEQAQAHHHLSSL